MLKNSLLSSFLGLFIIIAASNVSAKKLHVEPVLEDDGLHRPAKFKHLVSIQVLSPYNCTIQWCEGAILDEWHIITNANCIDEIIGGHVAVVAGASDLRNKGSGQYRGIERFYMPSTYLHKSKGPDDLAILKLKQPLLVGENIRIQAVKLPTADHSVEKLLMTSYGFAETHPNGTVKSTGKPVLRIDIEKINFDNKFCDAYDKEFCTVPQSIGTKSKMCNKWQGSPLVEEKLLANGEFEYTLIGVSKVMLDLCGIGAKYTKVSAYLDFISKVQNLVPKGESEIKFDDYLNKFSDYPYCSAV